MINGYHDLVEFTIIYHCLLLVFHVLHVFHSSDSSIMSTPAAEALRTVALDSPTEKIHTPSSTYKMVQNNGLPHHTTPNRSRTFNILQKQLGE